MPVQPPIIDPRDREALLQDLRGLIPHYTSHWRLGESGPGRALVEAFLLYQRDVIARLNRVPDKLFLAFLDRLGLSLLPALPARAQVTFALAEGATEEVTVPSGTQVAAGETVFETAAAFVTSPTALKAVFSVVPTQDLILDHQAALGNSEKSLLFTLNDTQKNLQEHSLYLGDTNLFNLKADGTIVLEVNAKPSNLLSSDGVEWGWGVTVQTWKPFIVTPVTGGTGLTLTKAEGEIKEIEINGIKSRWIRCRVKEKLLKGDPLATLTVSAIKVAFAKTGLIPDAAFYNDIPLPSPAEVHSGTAQSGAAGPPPTITLANQASATGDAYNGMQIEITGGTASDQIRTIINYNGTSKVATVDSIWAAVPDATSIYHIFKSLAPFGTRPRQGDTFYLASQEALSKPRATATLNVSGSMAVPKNLVLSWEYWDGNGWRVLAVTSDTTNQFSTAGEIRFTVPDDLQPTTVGGQKNYWVRVRIASGDYGQEIFTQGQLPATANIKPPKFSSLTVSYTVAPQSPSSIVTLNNLQYKTQTQMAPFFPFVPLEDEHQALYLGFDRPLINGPFSVLIALQERDYPEADRPRVIWEYSRSITTQPWGRLNPDDGTVGLIRTGMLTFVGPSDASSLSLFGQRLFWIRAVDLEDRFSGKIVPAEKAETTSKNVLPSPPEPCPEAILAFRSLFPFAPKGQVPVPSVIGIYPNAAWAFQRESIQGEVFGSSDGTANQSFRLARVPVVSASVWVNELGSLTDEEVARLKTDPTQIREETDLVGNRLALWVRWTEVADLGTIGRDDRAYLLDPVQGIIFFGDGLYGKVPPIGRENLKADYQVGGGSSGNVAVGKIKTLKSSLARIDKVTNPLPADGGADTESISNLIERGPQFLRHRNRAVTKEDYESLAKEASRAVAKVRCLPNFDDRGQASPGWVTVLIVPYGTEAQPAPSQGLKERVKAYLAARAPNVITGRNHLVVAGPVYLLFSVTVDLFPVSLDVAAAVEKRALEQLTSFLHPLAGGLDGRGWQFGQVPCLSDMSALLHGIDGVDHLEHLRAEVEEPRSGKVVILTMDDAATLTPSPFTLISSGEHQIHLKMKGA